MAADLMRIMGKSQTTYTVGGQMFIAGSNGRFYEVGREAYDNLNRGQRIDLSDALASGTLREVNLSDMPKTPYNNLKRYASVDITPTPTPVPTPVPTPTPTPTPAPIPVNHLDDVVIHTDDVIENVDDVIKNVDDDILKITDDVVETTSKFNWGKLGKWALIGVGIAAIGGLIGWGISKLCEKDEPQPQPEPTPVVEEPVEPPVPVEEPPVPEITSYAAQNGDGLWQIAERHLRDKYADEPDMFENLSRNEKINMINNEMERLRQLNNKEYKEVYDENGNIINIVPHPPIYPGDIINV